jgi:hypothetical protein
VGFLKVFGEGAVKALEIASPVHDAGEERVIPEAALGFGFPSPRDG